MTTPHTTAQLAAILAPLWEKVPETRPLSKEAWLEGRGDSYWQLRCNEGVTIIGNQHARDLILARLQLAIEARCCHVEANHPFSIDATVGSGASARYFNATHNDPIIARAQLLAKIVGVELGEA